MNPIPVTARRRLLDHDGKSTLAMIGALLLMAVLVFVGGCAHTSLQKVEDARDVYVAGLHEVNVLHRVGKVTVEQKRQMAPTTQAIADTLDLAEGTAAAGNDTQTNFYIATVNALLDQMLREAGIDPITLQKVK